MIKIEAPKTKENIIRQFLRRKTDRLHKTNAEGKTNEAGKRKQNVPPIINPTHIKETTKCFVDINKNPITFKGEAIVEVKTGKSNENCHYLSRKIKTQNGYWD